MQDHLRRGRQFLFLTKVIQLTLSLSQVSLTHSFVLTYKHQDVCVQVARLGLLVVTWEMRVSSSQCLIPAPGFFLDGWLCTGSWACLLYPLGTDSDCDLLPLHTVLPPESFRSAANLLRLVGFLSGCNLFFGLGFPLFYCSRCLEKLHANCSALDDLLI